MSGASVKTVLIMAMCLMFRRFGVSSGVPIKAARRFAHEAIAIDPNTA
ncbi:MAG: hypothetical protein ACFHHU_13505 [Porticoccaceae bacterium]